MKLYGNLTEQVSIQYREDTFLITVRPNQSTTYTAARDIQLPPGDTAHVIVSADATQTLTAKTLTSPILTTPTLGVATATSINKLTITAPATSATLTIADGKTLTASNTLTLTGTDSSSIALGAGGTVIYASNKLSALSATTSAELAGVISDETGSGLLVFGTSPALTSPSISAGSYINMLTQAAIRFNDDSGGDYVALQAPTGVTTHTLTLPAAQGAASTVLTNNGSGALSWGAALTTTLNQYNTFIGNSSNVATSTNLNLLGDISATTGSATVTITIAAPGVVSDTSHGLVTGDKLYLTTTGALPTGLSASTTYWVVYVDANSYSLASTLANAVAGTKITTSGSQSGTHTRYSGGLVLTSGVKGTITNDSATAGYLGENMSQFGVGGGSVNFSDMTIADVSDTITLTPGDWEVSGYVIFDSAGAATIDLYSASISDTTVALDVTNNRFAQAANADGTVILDVGRVGAYIPVGPTRFLIAAGATQALRMTARVGVVAGTTRGKGFIRARRPR